MYNFYFIFFRCIEKSKGRLSSWKNIKNTMNIKLRTNTEIIGLFCLGISNSSSGTLKLNILQICFPVFGRITQRPLQLKLNAV